MSKKICGFQSRKIAAFLAGTVIGLVVGGVCGCSSLQPATKSQSMTVTALGFPAITVVTTTSQAATNDGDDLGDVLFRSTEVVRDDGEFKNTLFGDEEFVALGKRLGGSDRLEIPINLVVG